MLSIPKDPPNPVITANPIGPYVTGQDIALTCTSPDSHPIMWVKMNSTEPLQLPMFEITGSIFTSILTIKDAEEFHSGTYICTVGVTRSDITIEVVMPINS